MGARGAGSEGRVIGVSDDVLLARDAGGRKPRWRRLPPRLRATLRKAHALSSARSSHTARASLLPSRDVRTLSRLAMLASAWDEDGKNAVRLTQKGAINLGARPRVPS
jgi:hypothetical protein